MDRHIPAPLTSGHLCPDCRGTGADLARTRQLKSYDSGYIRCWSCNGNGLDPAAYFHTAASYREVA